MNKRPSLKHAIGIAIGLLSSGFFLLRAFRNIDLRGVGDALLHSQWWPWFVIAPIIYCFGLLARGQRCRTILRPHRDLSLLTATNCTVVGYAANNLLPAR